MSAAPETLAHPMTGVARHRVCLGRLVRLVTGRGALVLLLLSPVALADSAGISGEGYRQIQEDGTALSFRKRLNFTGTGVTCTDDSSSSRTSCAVNTVAQTSWTAPTLLNSWVNYNASTHAEAGYMTDLRSFTCLKGLVKDGTVSTGTNGTIFVLPSGSRPMVDYEVSTSANGAFALVVIDSSGNVRAHIGSSTSFNLTGICFRPGYD